MIILRQVISQCLPPHVEIPRNLRSVQNHELILLPHHLAAPTTKHLRNTIDASNQNEDVRQGGCKAEDAWPIKGSEVDGLACSFCTSDVTQRKVKRQKSTQPHGHDLEDDTSNDHIIANIDFLTVGLVGRGSNSTTSGLEHDREDVRTDEDPCIQSRLQP